MMHNPWISPRRGTLVASLGLALVAALSSSAGHAEGQSAIGMLVDYKDWEIGCDNARSCVAIGMTSEDGTMSAYVRIVRDGGADDAPLVDFVVFPPDDATEALKQPLVRLSFDAHKAGGLPKGALTLEEDGELYRYQLAEDAIPDLLAGMRSATTITPPACPKSRNMLESSGSSAPVAPDWFPCWRVLIVRTKPPPPRLSLY